MSVNLRLVEAIQEVETDLAENVNVNDPTDYRKLTGFMDYLLSPVNPRTITTKMGEAGNAGKYRPVEIRTLPKKGDGDIIDAIGDYSCTRGTTRREIINTYNPTLVAGDKFTLDEGIIREGTNQDIKARLQLELRDAMRNAREKMDFQLYTAATNNIGANPAQGTGKGAYTTLEMLKADGSLSADTFDTIKNDQEDNYMLGTAGIVGLGNARKAFNRLAVGNVNDGGVDFAEVNDQFGMMLFKDSWTSTIQGAANADRVTVMYPGLTQFYQYNYYRNSDAANSVGDLSIKTTIQDPIYPITWDLHLKYDDGCSTDNPQGFWVGNLFTYHDLWITPEEAFGEGYSDNLNDFNGIVGYNITQAS